MLSVSRQKKRLDCKRCGKWLWLPISVASIERFFHSDEEAKSGIFEESVSG